MTDEKLHAYRDKRDTDASGEPSGKGSAPTSDDRPVFVVQRHDASRLHFDLRFEIAGVLVSWAVPKGPSVDPREKRLAVRVEDHPLDYADFEGRIGEGYGEGTVIVWDTGPYESLTQRDGEPIDADAAVRAGHLKVRLHGSKLTGAFALTRTGSRDGKEQWILVKIDDDGADRRRRPTSTQNESVLTGRTNEDLEDE
ncbi:DNA ligase D-like protein (predicted 3'-phosphoesterase) [Mumia flava]|uniref:DNA ligase D-like protein (Predicted 3'-phosphoesterase) n=1 Tax=Mumia flava TaxID=1348852 RepID=A0A0B2B2V4_9ACTN|nr:DNA polymerase ligase N-terminal domain-containing protein [Mumia flava]PJJ56136.1 DNA ligase D-like protein (predicted 3'-phosphoesterase) [Mumia flava]